jgi:hypothetical protein
MTMTESTTRGIEMHDSNDDPAWTIAMHEAGHIVTSMHWGVPVTTATIIPSGVDSGSATHKCVVVFPRPLQSPNWIFGKNQMLLCGLGFPKP